jgi:GT2 family glycosyltransferase
MLPLFPTAVIGAKRTGLSSWRATTDDPQFIFSFSRRRPHYCVLFLTPLEEALDPILYFDRGSGFGELDTHELRCGGMGIYAVSLAGLADVCRIRLDPATRPVRFRLRAAAAQGARALGRMVGRAIKRTEAGKGPAPVCEIVGEQADQTGLPKGLFKNRHFKGSAAHYVKVLTMAAVMPAPAAAAACIGAAPVLSFVVPVHNTPTRYLDDLLGSFQAQPWGSSEMVLSDDGSTSGGTCAWLSDRASAPGVKVIRRDANGGIAAATNAGIAAARGTWIGLVDHDDALSQFAVPRILDALYKKPRAAFLYTDEAITDASLTPVGYHLKPAYDPVLLSGVNYINHLSLYRRDRLDRVGGLRPGFEGSQDYDLLLRYLAGLDAREVVHLPFPAYLWRRHKQSFSTTALDQALATARLALGGRYGKAEAPLPVDPAVDRNLHRVRFDAAVRKWPRISIIVPSRDSYDLISRLIADLTARTDYPDREIIVVDNGTTDARVLALYEQTGARDPGFRYVIEPGPFNFSKQINRGIRLATGEHVLLLNNDIEVTDPLWLREMVSCLAYPGTGIVGARLLYPDLTLQHAGVIVGLAGLAGHWYHRKPESYPGMMGRLNVRQSLSAVTAACMLISRACLDATGSLDETAFAIAYNDVDYCLRAVGLGYRVVWTPFARLIHHESASRGSDETPANIERFGREKSALRERHRTDLFEDPAFSPWFSRNHSEPRLVLLDHLPEPR